MDLRGYVQAVRKYWWLVLLVILAGVGAAVAVTVTASPKYESSVSFFVSTPPGADGTALQADQYAQRRVNSYVGLLTSEVLANRIIADSGVDLTPAQVSASITASADLNTVLLNATVTDTSPERATAIATALSKQFGLLVGELDNRGSADNANVQLNVISGPTYNPDPVSPRKTLNIGLGFLVGLALGLALAILRQLLDTTIRTPQVLQTVTDVPVLGMIANERSARRSPLIVDMHARSIRAEALRQLRTNLQFTDAARPVGVLVVTSSIESEGKSSTSTNLALAFAAYGKRVLLIDADLRRPKVAEYLGLEGDVGLTNLLVGQAAIDDVLQPWGESGLVVLPSGTVPPNPSELLGGESMATLLQSLRQRFDMIVIDTPPLLPVTDAAVASRLADGAIVVVRYGKTTRHQLATALRSLTAVDARVLGTVLTMTPNKGAEAYKTYGYHENTKKRRSKIIPPAPPTKATPDPAVPADRIAAPQTAPSAATSPSAEPAPVTAENGAQPAPVTAENGAQPAPVTAETNGAQPAPVTAETNGAQPAAANPAGLTDDHVELTKTSGKHTS